MGSLYAEIAALGALPIAVAVTPIYAQLAFATSLGLKFPMLSDWVSEVAALYGVRYDSWKGHSGLAKRAVFVIDRDAKVQYKWETDDAELIPDFGGALDALRRLATGTLE